MSPPKKCAVCGDKALGYNFNAVTCESCKAFFRRNALAKKQFTCPFNQNCDITVVTRRFCQRCRLKKCLDIGMKSENIMSEEDKIIKRRKIESNREKRRQSSTSGKESRPCKNGDIKQEQQNVADSSSVDAYASYDSQSCGSFDSGTGQGSSGGGGGGGGSSGGGGGASGDAVPSSSNTMSTASPREVNIETMGSEEMVEYIVCDPDRACQAISHLMRTPREALTSLEKIINSQKDALRLIEHLIAYPGDALKIISKIMNSPFNALSVFTKFMSSPTDALEIISKIVSSPQDVLVFIKNLMDSPENAIDIMNKFMNTPAEALRIINKLFNGTGASATTDALDQEEKPPIIDATTKDMNTTVPETENTLLNSMLSNSPNTTSHSERLVPTAFTTKSTDTYVTTPTHTIQSLDSPISPPGSCEYQSPTTTTSISHNVSLISTSPLHITSAVNEFASEHFDLKTAAIHSQSNNNFAFMDNYDALNSLDNVLSEVIRIEYQAFNDLPPECVKHEYQTSPLTSLTATSHLNSHQQDTYDCGPQHHQQQHHHLPQSTPPICTPSSGLTSRDLNETEQMKLRELRLASEALYYPVDNDLSTLMMGDSRIKPEDTQQDPKLLNLINLTAVAIKRLIKMAKKIKAFRDMCQEDQVALLKGGCTEMMIMRSVMTYDGSRNTWKIPHTKEDMSNIRAEILKLAKGNLYEEHLKFIRTFDEKWRMDENIILIMCAIVLFMPSRPRIIHSDVIRLEQNSYYYLLRRYLESVYPGCEARSAFIKLIEKISDVERLNLVIIGVYLNVNPAQVEPLLREIFDLKNH